MKKILFGLSILTLLLLGNSRDSPPSPAPITVNIIGTWNYTVFTKNSICDSLIIEGTRIIEPFKGDRTKIGDTIIDGEIFKVDSNKNCYVDSIYKVSTKTSGLPSTGTRDDYLNIIREVTAGDNTIKSISVDIFNEYKIQDSIEYKNGNIITSIMTR